MTIDSLEATPAALLALDVPRQIAITISGKPVTFTFARVPDAAWRKFFSSVVYRIEQKLVDRTLQRVRLYDEDASLIALFEYVTKINGYAGSEGLGDIQLKARVPVRHRLAVCQVLRSVTAAADAQPALTDLVDVTLEAPWTVGDDGGMQMFTGLVHRFRQPTLDQFRRWRLGVSRTITTGDAENGTTTYPSRLAISLSLYDEMIAEVDGYSVHGVSLGSDLAAIQKLMDGMHKARAVLELFERDDDVIAIAEKPVPAEDDADDAAESDGLTLVPSLDAAADAA